MRARSRRPARLALAALAATLALGGSGLAEATTTTVPAHVTLTLSLPGPFVGCSVLDPTASPSLRALLDLVRPSAFLTSSTGVLQGSQVAVTSAELTSLAPQTVVYTIAPGLRWSNGHPFRAQDLVAWWRAARAQASVASDGYRAIRRLAVSDGGLRVTAVFAHPYSPWALLFHDVGYRGEPLTCPAGGLAAEPSLGPYRVVTASASQVVLVRDANWPASPDEPSRIVALVDQPLPASTAAPFASFSLTVDRGQIDELSSHAADLSHLGSSSGLEEVVYSPTSRWTRPIALREALSVGIDRTSLITALWGQVTFSPSVAASALYSQGDPEYPGVAGHAPSESTTSTTLAATSTTLDAAATAQADCVTCARLLLHSLGFRRTAAGLLSPAGSPVRLVVAYGPTDLDRTAATLIARQWGALGFATTLLATRSERQAVGEVATGHADAAVVLRQTTTSPATMARAFVGPAYTDAYSSGAVVAGVAALYHRAMDSFNAVSARSVWSELDHALLESFWVRPLFTPPSLEVWSPVLSGVVASDTLAEMVDQIPSWTYQPLTPTTSTTAAHSSSRRHRVH